MRASTIEDIEQIKKMLLKMPNEKVKEVEDFVEFVYTKFHPKEEKRVEKLEGIWEGLGFEKIPNVEQEVTNIRQEVESRFTKRGL